MQQGSSLPLQAEVIVLATVLKPVNDSRLYEKLALSLARHFPEKQIFLLGHRVEESAFDAETLPNLHFCPLFSFRRLSFKRMAANLILLKALRRLRPDLIVFATVELIPAILWYRFFKRVKIVYDVQENYYQNILYTRVYSPVLRHFLAFWVSCLEKLVKPAVDLFVFAEKCYPKQMNFKRKEFIVVENKLPRSLAEKYITKRDSSKQRFHWIYTGTISTDYGVFEAIQLAKKMYTQDERYRLTIAGYAIHSGDYLKLRKEIENLDFIHLIGGDQQVSHWKVLEELSRADLALLPYRQNKNVLERIPTKMYECLALQVPMLVQNNPFWEELLAPYRAACFIDFGNPGNDLAEKIQQMRFYATSHPFQGIYWEEEENKWIQDIAKLSQMKKE